MNPMLAKSYAHQSPTGWWISEKLDGVRAIWTGTELQSRTGNRFFAPDWFTAQLPAGVMLDGELFIARGAFQQLVSVVRKNTPVDAEWLEVTYQVFDAPAFPGGFEERLDHCRQLLDGCAIATTVAHTKCRGGAHLQSVFERLVAAGAEGVMLRAPGSAYDQNRSPNLLKMKPSHSDEAEVIGYEDGKGRHAGRLGALVCTWNGHTFKLGTGLTDEQRECPPRIGARVTFGFQELTNGGIPRFPTFVAERNYE